jgi:hypothetical protein
MRAWLMLVVSILMNVAGNLLVRRFSTTVAVRSLWDFLSFSLSA